MKRGAVFAWLATALIADAALADEPTHAGAFLDYAVPKELATCPDRDTFVTAVATRLGYDPFAGTEGTRKTLVVRFHRDRTAINVTLRLDASEKNIVSESGACDELGSAAAFAAAIMIDPRAMFPKPPKPPAPPGASGDSNSPGTWPWYEPPPTLPKPEKPEPPPPPPLKFHGGLVLTGCAGCGPSPNPGAGIFFGIGRERFGLDLGARADLPTSASAPSGHDVHSSLVVAELFPHARFGIARIGLLGSVGALFGSSGGQNQTSLWASAGARVGIDWAFSGPFFLRAMIDGVVVIGRVALRVDGGEVWSSPGFAGGVSLGAGVEF